MIADYMREVMDHDRLDTIIQDALRRLVTDLNSMPWFGRERELVSLFAFCHLLETGANATPAMLPGQIGIEVAVPQHPPHGGSHRKANVCKDLVIWPAPRMTAWQAPDRDLRYPLAVMEWKSYHNIGISERRSQKLREEKRDIDWLSEASAREPRMRGYFVVIDLLQSPKTLLCTTIAKGVIEPTWIIE